MWLLWLTNLPQWKSENKTEGKFGSLPFFLSFIHGMWLRLIPLVDCDKEKWSSASACIAFSASAVLCFVDLRKDKTVFPKCCVWDLLLWEIHATAVKRTLLIVTSWECTNALRPTQLDNCHKVLFLANPEQIWGYKRDKTHNRRLRSSNKVTDMSAILLSDFYKYGKVESSFTKKAEEMLPVPHTCTVCLCLLCTGILENSTAEPWLRGESEQLYTRSSWSHVCALQSVSDNSSWKNLCAAATALSVHCCLSLNCMAACFSPQQHPQQQSVKQKASASWGRRQ